LEVSKEKKKQAKDDERIRNSIEGKFGEPVAPLGETPSGATGVSAAVATKERHP